MTLIGTGQNVSLTGDEFAAALGLKSDWFTADTTLGGPAVGMAATRTGKGYWVAAANGASVRCSGMPPRRFRRRPGPHTPVVGMAATPDGKGYWLVASDGGIFSYGDAHFYGSTGNLVLNKPVVGMAATADGNGYWLVAADGGRLQLRRRALLRLDRQPGAQPAGGRDGGDRRRQGLLAGGLRRGRLRIRRRKLRRFDGRATAQQSRRRDLDRSGQ